MKQLKKRFACVLLALCALLPVAGCTEDAKYTQIIVTPTEFAEYTQSARTQAVQMLENCFAGVMTQIVGTPPTDRSLLRLTAERVVSAMQAREVAEETLLEVLSALTQNEEMLYAFFSQESFPLHSAVSLFSALSTPLGADKTARLMGDFAQIYCSYQVDVYVKSYYQSPQFTFLKEYADAWKAKREGLADLGEDNVSRLLRLLVSASGIFSQTLPVGGRETALFVRTQGELLDGLTLGHEDYSFLLSWLGEEENGTPYALAQSGAAEKIAVHAPTLVKNLSVALAGCTAEQAERLLQGNAWEFIHGILQGWDDEAWTVLDDALSAHTAANEGYAEYLSAAGHGEAYGAFLTANTGAALDEVRSSSKENFASVCKQYVFSHSPALAFMVFEL